METTCSELTHFLYAKPSFLEGWGRILDFGNTLTEYNVSATGEQADYLALKADWMTVGCDMMNAFRRFQEQIDALREQVSEKTK